MKNKKIFKKWWFWVIVVVILGAIGPLGQSDNKSNETSQTNSSQQASADGKSTLPQLNSDDYKGKEGLVAYKDLQSKGYKVEAEFENQALTDINGKASDLFARLNLNKPNDRQSVDAFVVGDLVQDGDNIKLTITQSAN